MADTNAKIKVPMSDVMKNVTMNVEVETTGYRVYSWRLKIAMLLMRLAARVAGVGIKIET